MQIRLATPADVPALVGVFADWGHAAGATRPARSVAVVTSGRDAATRRAPRPPAGV